MSSGEWDYSLFWKEALSQIREEISEQEFMMWFKNIGYDSSGEASLVLQVPSVFYKDQVRQRYERRIEEKLQELCGSPIAIDYVIRSIQTAPEEAARDISAPRENITPAAQPADAPPAALTRAAPAHGASVLVQDPPRRKHPSLRGDYTFENFVIGENNSFAANAAIAIAKNPVPPTTPV